MKKISVSFLLIMLALSVSAHKRWVLPSLFSVSEPQWITVDASVSNNLFYPDRPWPLSFVRVVSPNGENVPLSNQSEGHRRSTFDFEVSQKGTYKVVAANTLYFVQYKETEQGETKRMRASSLADIKKRLPEKLFSQEVAKSDSTLESYVSLGAPNNQVFKESNSAVQFKPVTHPNDLYQGEEGVFGFTVNDQPLVGAEVIMVWEGTRYRDDEQVIEMTTNNQGQITLPLSQTGRFYLELSHSQEVDNEDYDKAYVNYLGTFEVLPQ